VPEAVIRPVRALTPRLASFIMGLAKGRKPSCFGRCLFLRSAVDPKVHRQRKAAGARYDAAARSSRATQSSGPERYALLLRCSP
jgi:hypothetical protein